MEKAVTKTETNPVKALFAREDVKNKFQELLGKKTTGFMSSVLSIVNNNSYLKNATPETIYTSAMMAAMLDLPINQNLGFAYIIPYGKDAQFQIGYKGLIQLALRSGQFKTISATPIYDGQLIDENPLTGFVFDFKNKTSEKIIGYAGYFSLLNGFEKTLYMSRAQVEAHGTKFSKTYNSNGGVWKKDFDAMAVKTVLKLLIGKYAPMSVEMQKAIIADQSVIKDTETLDVTYIDEGKAEIVVEDLQLLYEMKKESLSNAERADIERIISEQEISSYAKLKTILNEKNS